MRLYKRFSALVFLLMVFAAGLLLPHHGLASELESTVDRTTLALNETLTLKVRFNGQALADPDFSSLNKDFEILSQQQQNQLTMLNGNRDSYTTWTLQLLPKHKGKLLIPSFNLKGEVSNAIELTVRDTPPNTAASDQPIFIETLIDKDDIYVQEQLLLTHRLYTRVNLNSVSSDELHVDHANVVKLSENQFQKTINGQPHLVVEITYAIFPEANGELEIPSIRYTAVVPDNRDPFGNSFFSRGGRQVFLRTDAKTIRVKPKPPSENATEWLPGKGLSLTEKWSRPLDELRVGEPVTRTITVVAQGLTSSQLAPLAIPDGEGFRLYPDQAQMNDEQTASGVIGRRIESVAIVPTRAGSIQLPPISVQWWDTNADKRRETTLEGRTVQVLPAVGEEAPADPVTHVVSSSAPEEPIVEAQPAGKALVLLLAAGNILLLIAVAILGFALLRNRKYRGQGTVEESKAEADEKALFKSLRQAAGNRQYGAFQLALFNWARHFWRDNSISTLAQISLLSQSEEVANRLADLDRAIFSPSADTGKQNPVDLLPVVNALDYVRQDLQKASKANVRGLKPLYNHQ